MTFLVPQGIGDSIWSLFKVQSIAEKHLQSNIDIKIACWYLNEVETRALDFVRRFDFVTSAGMYRMPQRGNHGPVLTPGPPADENGYFRYMDSGPNVVGGIDYVLIANTPLERGIRLEDWLPEYETNWKLMDSFKFTIGELNYADEFYKDTGDFVALYMSSEGGNGPNGHNRGPIWTPKDWIDLGNHYIDLGYKVVVLGTSYDVGYFDNRVKPLITDKYTDKWINCIDKNFGIGQTYAVLRKAKFLISYQSGIAIVGNYLGVPTGVFWRAKGDSISSHSYISFEESMSSAWANPKQIKEGKHLPLIYGRHDVKYIIDEVKNRNWI